MSEAKTYEPDYGTGTKKLSIYITGLIICIILTLIPFGVVMYDSLAHWKIYSIIFSAAILQFFTQVICFLRLNTSTEQSRINVMSFVFSTVILVVIVGGSVWIMWSLDYNMMH